MYPFFLSKKCSCSKARTMNNSLSLKIRCFFNSACVLHSILLLVVSSLAVYSIHLLLLLCDKTGNINSHFWPLLYPTHSCLPYIICDYNSSQAVHQVKNLKLSFTIVHCNRSLLHMFMYVRHQLLWSTWRESLPQTWQGWLISQI